MILTKKLFFPLLALTLSATAFSGVPSMDQAGMYTGKGKTTFYYLDSKKLVKVSGSATVEIAADGTVSLKLPTFGGATASFTGTGNFGLYLCVYRDTEGNDARLQFKGSGSKISTQVTGRYVSTSEPYIVEFSAKLKKALP